ncbi:MAG: ABC transporter ATP-binding protein [Clostridia bacterium]|nr:ABC transporter ATP-binding protein [Clostridia bacterium]
MDKDVVISVENISKKFRVYIDKGSQLKERMLFKERNRYQDRPVLKDISFSVRKGEAIGLVGHNGCGKSTTLKLLTRIMYPDSGKITMKGRVVALIELGAGFHPDMSGRENIYFNAAIFGLSRKEIDDKVEDIIAFSELEEFIDNPVRTYSSGMYTRLAFSVAISIDADILLIDEILAVGDAGFQAKCFNRLKQIKAQGTTIVIVSHSLGQIEEICDRSYWIHEGLIKSEGKPVDVHEQYLDYIADYRQEVAAKEVQRQESKRIAAEKKAEEAEAEAALNSEENDQKESTASSEQAQDNSGEEIEPTAEELVSARKGDGTVIVKKVLMYNSNNVAQTIFKTDDKIRVDIDIEVKSDKEQAIGVAIGFLRLDGVLCYSTNTLIDGYTVDGSKGKKMISFEVDKLSFLPGGYAMDVAIVNEDGSICDYLSNALSFEMICKHHDSGVFRLNHSWRSSSEE